jgi:hypothetical protein
MRKVDLGFYVPIQVWSWNNMVSITALYDSERVHPVVFS